MGTAGSSSAVAAPGGVAFVVRGVTRTFSRGEVDVHVLRGIDVDIPAGKVTVILGPSGSGKTTLLNLLGGIDRPSSGSVRFTDHELSDFDDGELNDYRRDHVGYIFQFYNLIPTLTAIENVQVTTELAGDPMDPHEALRLVGLDDREDHFPAQLSGGEQQRVAVARALAKNPDVLLCDEPTGALDLETGRKVLRLLRDVCQDLNKTVVIVTHNTAIAAMADRVVRLGSGVIDECTDHDQPIPPEEVRW